MVQLEKTEQLNENEGDKSLLSQSRKVDAFLLKIKSFAHNTVRASQIAQSRSELDSHTAAETILAYQPTEYDLSRMEKEILGQVVLHEINNFTAIARYSAFLSSAPPIPDQQWAIGSPGREEALVELGTSWQFNTAKMSTMRAWLSQPFDPELQKMDLDTILGDVTSIYAGGLFLAEDDLYPHHSISVDAYKGVVGGFKNVADIFIVEPDQRMAILKEINATEVTVEDFLKIYPNPYEFQVSGDLNRKLNQFDINLLFEMLQNARKYRKNPDEPIDVYLGEDVSIVVTNKSNLMIHHEAELGMRGDNTDNENGHGFGLAKMRDIADMNNEVVTYDTELLDDAPGNPTYIITCSLKKAA